MAKMGCRRIAQGGIDVVALDHYLTTGTGLDVLAALSAAENQPPVVYVTGSAETAIAVAALKAGASDYVPKTVGDEFLELLASAIDHAMDTRPAAPRKGPRRAGSARSPRPRRNAAGRGQSPRRQ